MMHSMRMMVTGFVMLAVGWAVLFAIVIDLLPASFFLNFAAYGVSFAGLSVGLVGILDHIRPGRG